MLALIALLLTLWSGGIIHGEATYYHPSLAGQTMRNGEVYEEDNPTTVAVGIDHRGFPVVPLGSRLLVCSSAKCIQVEVRDTGLFPPTHLDLSFSAFEELDEIQSGRISIKWLILQ